MQTSFCGISNITEGLFVFGKLETVEIQLSNKTKSAKNIVTKHSVRQFFLWNTWDFLASKIL